jgi:hypothetical protein
MRPQAGRADDDQIDGDDIIEKTGNQQDQDAADQCNERRKQNQIDGHHPKLLFFLRGLDEKPVGGGSAVPPYPFDMDFRKKFGDFVESWCRLAQMLV